MHAFLAAAVSLNIFSAPFTIHQTPVEEPIIVQIDNSENPSTVIPVILGELFEAYFINEQQMPLVISPNNPYVTLFLFGLWVLENRDEIISLLPTSKVLLLRNFPVADEEEFGSMIQSILNRRMMDDQGEEGYGQKVSDGVNIERASLPIAFF